MHGIDHRPQKTDGNRRDAFADEPIEGGKRRGLVERSENPAIGVDALRNFMDQTPGDVRSWVGDAEIERIGPPAFPQGKHVGMTAGDQQRGLGGVSGQDCVDRVSGRVHEDLAARQQFRQRHAVIGRGQRQRIERAAHRVARQPSAL